MAKIYNSPLMAERRATIALEARKMLSEAGYDGLNMRDLARRSGVAISTLYNQFASKDMLITAVVSDIFSATFKGLEETGSRETPEMLQTLARRIAQTTRRQPAYSRAMVAIYFSSSKASVVRSALQTPVQKWLSGVMKSMAKRGDLLPNTDIALIVHEIIIHMWAQVHDWVIGGIRGPRLALHFEMAMWIHIRPVAAPCAAADIDSRLTSIMAELKTKPVGAKLS